MDKVRNQGDKDTLRMNLSANEWLGFFENNREARIEISPEEVNKYGLIILNVPELGVQFEFKPGYVSLKGKLYIQFNATDVVGEEKFSTKAYHYSESTRKREVCFCGEVVSIYTAIEDGDIYIIVKQKENKVLMVIQKEMYKNLFC